jgi:hypothetical protein
MMKHTMKKRIMFKKATKMVVYQLRELMMAQGIS